MWRSVVLQELANVSAEPTSPSPGHKSKPRSVNLPVDSTVWGPLSHFINTFTQDRSVEYITQI